MSILHKIYHFGCVYDDWVQLSVYRKIDCHLIRTITNIEANPGFGNYMHSS